MDQEKIGKYIADMRKKQNMTQKQMADVIGIIIILILLTRASVILLEFN